MHERRLPAKAIGIESITTASLTRWFAVAIEFTQLLNRLIDDYEEKMPPAA